MTIQSWSFIKPIYLEGKIIVDTSTKPVVHISHWSKACIETTTIDHDDNGDGDDDDDGDGNNSNGDNGDDIILLLCILL